MFQRLTEKITEDLNHQKSKIGKWLEQRERYIFLKRLNTRYLKDNTRLLRMVRLQRLQLKEAKANPSSHLALSTLAEATISLQPPETSQGPANTPNMKPSEEAGWGNRLERHFWAKPNKFCETGLSVVKRALEQSVGHRKLLFSVVNVFDWLAA